MKKNKIKKIGFFTVGFAFNRLVRMRFYEKIFPKNIELYLITTDKYKTRKSDTPQQDYKLSRTKVETLHYGLALPLRLRKFCRENKIGRLINLGFHTSAPILFLATAFTKTNFCINILVDIFRQHYLTNMILEKIRDLFTLFMLFVFVMSAKKAYFTDPLNAARAPLFFMTNKKRLIFLAAPVDTNFFFPRNKESARRKLKIGSDNKIILYVGRANYLRSSDILKELIERNKDWKFIVVGPLIDSEIKKVNAKNLIHIEKLSQEGLRDYYAASDFVFCLNRGGGGIGLSSEEALACGKPIIISKHFKARECEAVYQTDIDYAQAKESIDSYFKLPLKQKEKMSKTAVKYAYDNYSYDAWKEPYIEAYLN